MSCTIGHSDPRRPANDFYETPAWCTRALLAYLDKHKLAPKVHGELSILDPGAGTGAISKVLRAWRPNANIWAIENDLALSETLQGAACKYNFGMVGGGDFFLVKCIYDLIVCNPPYSGPNREDLAMRFVEHGRKIASQAWFLLRLNWLESQGRAEYFREIGNRPMVLVLPRRPSFTSNGRTDGTGYAWMGWGLYDMFRGTWDVLDIDAGAKVSK